MARRIASFRPRAEKPDDLIGVDSKLSASEVTVDSVAEFEAAFDSLAMARSNWALEFGREGDTDLG